METHHYHIDELYKIADYLGIEIKINFNLKVSGKTHYLKALIEINEPKAKDALITLAHELGHYIFYLDNREKEQPPVIMRERAAYRLGWYLLRKIDANITKEEWIDYHNPDFLNVKETGGWLIEKNKRAIKTVRP